MEGLEYLLNPCEQLDAQLHPVLEPEVGSNFDDKYSVTQLSPGDCCYVKWWESGLIPRA